MEVTDLMVDDWVQKLEVGGHYRKCRIKAIIDNNVDCEISDGEVHTLSVNGIEPITLTNEILQKNGFRYDDTNIGWELGTHDFTIGYGHIPFDENEDYLFIWVAEKIVRLDYVHNLQHALKLCGIDKNIEL